MKRFLIDIFIVFLIICGGLVGLEILLSDVQNEYSYKNKYLLENKDAISILILGHSHTAWGINPNMLDSAFNAAKAARPLYYDVRLTEKWVPSMKNLKVLIIPHGYDFPWGFFNLHYWNKENKEWKQNIIYMHFKYMDIPYIESLHDFLFHTALFSNNLAMGSFHDEEMGLDTYDVLGFVWHAKEMHQDSNWKNDDNVHIQNIGADSLYEYVCEYTLQLKEIAKICHENNVRLIAVTTPCHESYLEQTNEIGLQTLYDIIDSIRVTYPIEYYNYLSDKEFRADSFYYDCSHLNYVGAEHFTKRLKKDLGL